MTEERLPLAELLAKAGDGDFGAARTEDPFVAWMIRDLRRRSAPDPRADSQISAGKRWPAWGDVAAGEPIPVAYRP